MEVVPCFFIPHPLVLVVVLVQLRFLDLLQEPELKPPLIHSCVPAPLLLQIPRHSAELLPTSTFHPPLPATTFPLFFTLFSTR